MGRGPRYIPLVGMLLLGIGVLLGAGGAWLIVPSLFGSTKSKAPAPAPTVKKAPAPAPAEVARTVALVDQVVVAGAAKPAAPTDAKNAPGPDVSASPDATAQPGEPVPPEQEVVLPEYVRVERPFALRCATVLNHYDRASGKLEAVSPDAFCGGLRGHYSVVIFWRSDSEPARAALELFQKNAEALKKGPPAVQIAYVSADRFLSDLKAFYDAEGADWTFDTYQTLVDGWLTNYGSSNPDRGFPWLIVTDPDRMVVFEGHAMQTQAELKGFEKFLAATAADRPNGAKNDELKAADVKVDDAKAKAAEGPRKEKLVDAAARKSAPAAGSGGSAGRREIDYVTLGLQVMRLFPDLAGTPELRQVVKLAEGSLNAKLKKMNPGEANRLVSNLPDALVRDAVKAALKSLGK